MSGTQKDENEEDRAWSICNHVEVCDVWARVDAGTNNVRVYARLPHPTNRAQIVKLSGALCTATWSFEIQHNQSTPIHFDSIISSDDTFPYNDTDVVAVRYALSSGDVEIVKITMDQPDGATPKKRCDASCRCEDVSCVGVGQ